MPACTICKTRNAEFVIPKNVDLRNISLDLHFNILTIENRIFIREELKESLGMDFFSPFQPKKKVKVYKSCK